MKHEDTVTLKVSKLSKHRDSSVIQHMRLHAVKTNALMVIHGLFLNKGASFEKLTHYLESMLVIVQFLLVSPAYRHFMCHLQLLQ